MLTKSLPLMSIRCRLGAGQEEGRGRLGDFPTPLSLGEFAKHVREQIGAKLVQTVGPAERMVQRVAHCPGAAGEFQPDAIEAGRRRFSSPGKARFHDCLAAQVCFGIALVLAGHFTQLERFAVEELAGCARQGIRGAARLGKRARAGSTRSGKYEGISVGR